MTTTPCIQINPHIPVVLVWGEPSHGATLSCIAYAAKTENERRNGTRRSFDALFDAMMRSVIDCGADPADEAMLVEHLAQAAHAVSQPLQPPSAPSRPRPLLTLVRAAEWPSPPPSEP